MRGFINKTPRSLYLHKDLSVEAIASIIYYENLRTIMHQVFTIYVYFNISTIKSKYSPITKIFLQECFNLFIMLKQYAKKLNQKATL